MDKQVREEIIEFLTKILNKSKKLEYEFVEIEDDEDINFFVTPKIKALKDDENRFNFIIYCSDKTTLTIYCPTFYRIKEDESLMFTLNAINVVNSKMAVGKIYLNNENGAVVSFINRILFNDITKELTVNLLDDYINSYFISVLEFYEQMKEMRND